MRTPTLAAIAAILASTGAAEAQPRVGQSPEARPGRPGIAAGQPRVNLPGPRWGGKVRGRWYGGYYAPGGWAAYRTPARGWVMPRYWVAPSFFVQDWPAYGLSRPQAGYGWYRYYDDAVLADRDGRVVDYRRGIDWDARDTGRYVRDDRAYDRYLAENDAPPPPPPPPPVARRDDGVGGAVIGGVAGGVAGNVIAGRGNRLGGTLIGAGGGALAGTAIDRAEDRRAPPPPPPPPVQRGYGADYPLPGGDVPVAPDDGYYDDAPGVVFGPMREEVQPIRPSPRGGYVERHVGAAPVARSYTTTTTTEGPGGYIADGYYYPPRTVTTVTIQNAPVTTTTTEEVVTYETRRPSPRRAHRSKLLRR
ncbi:MULTISPECIES: RcnB family protein [unclassified Sphingomonas]|uniref:RcnB family protein n=1 Tax=unclassified Sphingomonas TaxID=196159 RepID=UPI0006FB6E87|nr:MULTISPECIES: RcnB family protein [unclassified Sphingomonas]KQM28656.1 hypothetical protein ASE58_01930 [Sphingomonas sp. Leaf9]KQM45359.1 hypothetical protein ASE57_01925 [Sphingomonas sp. Leaf11]